MKHGKLFMTGCYFLQEVSCKPGDKLIGTATGASTESAVTTA